MICYNVNMTLSLPYRTLWGLVMLSTTLVCVYWFAFPGMSEASNAALAEDIRRTKAAVERAETEVARAGEQVMQAATVVQEAEWPMLAASLAVDALIFSKDEAWERYLVDDKALHRQELALRNSIEDLEEDLRHATGEQAETSRANVEGMQRQLERVRQRRAALKAGAETMLARFMEEYKTVNARFHEARARLNEKEYDLELRQEDLEQAQISLAEARKRLVDLREEGRKVLSEEAPPVLLRVAATSSQGKTIYLASWQEAEKNLDRRLEVARKLEVAAMDQVAAATADRKAIIARMGEAVERMEEAKGKLIQAMWEQAGWEFLLDVGNSLINIAQNVPELGPYAVVHEAANALLGLAVERSLYPPDLDIPGRKERTKLRTPPVTKRALVYAQKDLVKSGAKEGLSKLVITTVEGVADGKLKYDWGRGELRAHILSFLWENKATGKKHNVVIDRKAFKNITAKNFFNVVGRTAGDPKTYVGLLKSLPASVGKGMIKKFLADDASPVIPAARRFWAADAAYLQLVQRLQDFYALRTAEQRFLDETQAYIRELQAERDGVQGKRLLETKPDEATEDQPVSIELSFSQEMDRVDVTAYGRLRGKGKADAAAREVPVKLTSSDRLIWTGTLPEFKPSTVKLTVSGESLLNTAALDSDPSTTAVLVLEDDQDDPGVTSGNQASLEKWRNYESGLDTNHRLQIEGDEEEDEVTSTPKPIGPIDLSGLWVQGENVLRLEHQGSSVTAFFVKVRPGLAKEYGFREGDRVFSGLLSGRDFVGTINSHFPVKYKKQCPAVWSGEKTLKFTVSESGDALAGEWKIDSLDVANCALKDAGWQSYELMREGADAEDEEEAGTSGPTIDPPTALPIQPPPPLNVPPPVVPAPIPLPLPDALPSPPDIPTREMESFLPPDPAIRFEQMRQGYERMSPEEKRRFREALRRIPPDKRGGMPDWMRRLIED